MRRLKDLQPEEAERLISGDQRYQVYVSRIKTHSGSVELVQMMKTHGPPVEVMNCWPAEEKTSNTY